MKKVFCLVMFGMIMSPDFSQTNSQESVIFVLIGKSRIYFHRQGAGNPAVVFVSGMAHDHTTWKSVQDSISVKTLTVSYDRAGLGKSEYHGEEKNITAMATELNELLIKIAIPSPFILVGHSLGCQIIKKYASLYPKQIKGLVFVDPGYNENILKLRIPDSLWQKRNEMIKKYQMEFNDAQEAENKMRNESCEEADKITQLPNVPVVLLTATMVTGFPASAMEQKLKKERHLSWLKTIPGAKHILVNTSWHYIHTDAPAEVVKAIDTLIAK